MFKFAANLNFLFTEVPFMQRFKSAKEAGFKYVEFMFPYEYDINEIKEELRANDIKLIHFNLPAGNWDSGDRGLGVDSNRKTEFLEGVKKAITTALELEVTQLNCLVGNKCDSVSSDEMWSNLIDNLGYAANELNKHNIKLMIEPINHFDMPKFYLNTTEQVMKLIDDINSPNIYLQYDVYHGAREEENPRMILENYFDKIGHIQVADSPDRFQPGTGQVDYDFMFKELERLNYEGYISMEYKPSPNTIDSLKWLEIFDYKL